MLSSGLVSCKSISDLAEEAAAGEIEELSQGEGAGPEGQPGQEDYDYDYARSMNDNFSDYQVEEGHQCFHMQGNTQQTNYQLPMQRPRGHGQTFGSNQFGRAVDGSQIIYNQNAQNKWQFQTNPYILIQRQGNGRMIGMHRNGAPIYGLMISNYEQAPNVDQYGGRYSPTPDFPNGIYHYLITIRIN